MNPIFPTFFKPVFAICGAAAVWAGQIIADALPSTDMSWFQLLIKDVGLPVAFLVLTITGGIAVYRELKSSQSGRLSDRALAEAGRLADRDAFQAALMEITQRIQDRQERMIVATDNLSSEFAHLADKINSCQQQRRP